MKRLSKIAGFAALGIFGWAGAFHPQLFSFLNGTNILFHEAGHLFFSPFGEYLGIWGGTLTQLLFPLGIAVAFYVKKQKPSAAVMIWWFGQNFFGISIYIKDAVAQELPLIGGEIHDWGYILTQHGILGYDQQVGNIVWVAGFLIMSAAVIYGLLTIANSNRKL